MPLFVALQFVAHATTTCFPLASPLSMTFCESVSSALVLVCDTSFLSGTLEIWVESVIWYGMGSWVPYCLLRVADFSEDKTSYLLSIKRICCMSLYLLKIRVVKCSAKSLQVLTQTGLFKDYTSAVPSTIATFTMAVLPVVLVFFSAPLFSRMCISVLLHKQCNVVPSAGHSDLGTTVNSYRLRASLMSTSCRLLQTIIRRANRDRSSLSSTTRSTALSTAE